MSRIVCPALRSDDALGFLAALGVLELSTSIGLGARLGWEGIGEAAVVEADVTDLHELVDVLHAAARDLSSKGRVIPAPHATVLPKRLSKADREARKDTGDDLGVDPLRLRPDEAVRRYREVLEREHNGDYESSRWLVSLVNQLANQPGRANRALTPLYSPSAQMTLYQLFRDALTPVTEDQERLRQALEGWRREEGTGANLDARALRDAVVTADGQSANRAVLGATWLALMAVPLFPQASHGGRVDVIGWDAAAKGGAALRWPIWRQPLDRTAVEVLLSHPAVVRAASQPPERGDASPTQRGARKRHDAALQALAAMGVEAICVSRRRPLGKGGGALLPPSVVPVPRVPVRTPYK